MNLLIILVYKYKFYIKIINKKYLSEEQLELLKQDAIEFEIKDPF